MKPTGIGNSQKLSKYEQMKGKLLIIAGIILLTGLQVFSQENVPVDSANTNIKPVLTISRCPNSAIKIDGIIDEKVWDSCNTATDFVEIEPGDNNKAVVRTEVKMTYDDDFLYAAFICYDDNMSKLRVSLTDRDKMFNDDYVGLLIDTYNDHKQAYEVFLNPYGIQGDGIWTRNSEEMNFDMLYDSEAKIYKDRWVVEIAIPFKSLRFPEKDEQQWSVHIIRTRPRESRMQMSWASISRDNSELMSQAGTVKGFKKLKKGKQLELLPYVIASQYGFREYGYDPNSKFINKEVKADLGIGVKYGITSNLTGELTLNPDFSQVESDATQINVNSSSAIFYPEKRPFFLDGVNVFNSYLNVVYTRMMNNPVFAAKLIGKVNDIDVGLLMDYDQNTPYIIPYTYGSDFIPTDLKSFGTVLRLKKSLDGQSYLGLIGTDREVGDSYNRVAGFDGSLKFGSQYYFNWQLMGYFTKELNRPDIYENNTPINNDSNDAGFNGESYSNYGGTLSFNRNSRSMNTEVFLNIAPPEARRDLGFMGSNNFRELGFYQGFTFYPRKSIILRVEPSINGGIQYDYDDRIKQQWLIPQIFMQFKNLVNFSAGFLAVNNEIYYDVNLRNVNRGWGSLNINTLASIRGGVYYELGKYIVRDLPTSVGWGFNAELWLTLKPTDNLLLENTYNYSELSTEAGGEKFYSGYIFRNKTSFQFTSRFFLRLVLQYDSFGKVFNLDPLFSYKWNPFTIFYIGSTNEITDYGSSPEHSRFVQSQRQFFAKFQYLFRF